MLKGTINQENVRIAEIARTFGWQAAVRCYLAKHDRKHTHTFLTVALEPQRFWEEYRRSR